MEAPAASEESRTPAAPRSLLLETPVATITLSEDGEITLVLRGYACSASAISPGSGEGAPPLPPELESLFRRASSREVRQCVARAEDPGAAHPEEGSPGQQTLTLRNSEGDTLYAVTHGDIPESSPLRPVLEMEEAIRRAVYIRFRKALEDRCGPIPGSSPGSIP
jgi:hypothetical protein